ncbi:MAG: DUF4825 domain-containing protein [Clostridiales Family XIII bacterium]|nr:DUF4825 domain-containing protein [Clostridiales Family XIII bacterium]
MTDIFLIVLNMSLTSMFVIAALCLARLALRKIHAHKWISYALWGAAGFNLICPFKLESAFSLIPFNCEPIPRDIAMQAIPRIDSGISIIDNAVSSSLPAATLMASVNPLQAWIEVGACVWLVGVAAMLLYAVISYVRLIRRKDSVKTPFVYGFIKPKIHIPGELLGEALRYATLHEQTHINRRDYLVKPVAVALLCIHWFNPLEFKKRSRIITVVIVAFAALLTAGLALNGDGRPMNTFEELSLLRTPYVGNSSAVGKIVDALPPLGARHSQKFFSIGDDYGTGHAPYTLTLYYEQSGKIRNDYAITPRNAAILLALIDNLDEVSYAIRTSPSGDMLDKAAYSEHITWNRAELDDYLATVGLTWDNFREDWGASIEAFAPIVRMESESRPTVVVYEHTDADIGYIPFKDSSTTDRYGLVTLPARTNDDVIVLNDIVFVVATASQDTVQLELFHAESQAAAGTRFCAGSGTPGNISTLISDFRVAELYPAGYSGQIWAVSTDADGNKHYSECLNVEYAP